MVKNDYRRSLIMLRPHAPGYSGHVRLERRTLMGSMFFVINVPASCGELCAALVRRNAQDTYFAVKLGELRRDGRGQATLAYSFDPRNIDGRPLEDYLLITVVHRDSENCDVVLSGNVNGSVEVNWNSVRAASCEACTPPRTPACDLCPPAPQPRPSQPSRPGTGGEVRPTPSQPSQPVEDEGEPTPSEPSQPEEGEESGPVPGEPSRPEESGENRPIPNRPSQFVGEPENGDGREETLPTAGETLGIDLSAPWPGVSEQLREMFASQPARELMLNDGYTYVTAPMPEGSGYDHVEVGVRIRDGVPDSVAYAIPARYTPEPPPGLEDYRWQGGASEGWWTVHTDPSTGEIRF